LIEPAVSSKRLSSNGLKGNALAEDWMSLYILDLKEKSLFVWADTRCYFEIEP